MKTPDDIGEIIYNKNYWISKNKLKELLKQLFYISLKKEEGRYPHFQIFIPFKGDELSYCPLKFETPESITKDFLHRIAPGFADRPLALSIYENNGELFSVGLITAEASGFSFTEALKIDYTISSPVKHGLIIRIVEPGNLLIKTILNSGLIQKFEYKGGDIQEVFDLNISPLFFSLAENLRKSINKKYNPDNKYSDSYIRGAVLEIVSNAASYKHGASFIFLPEGITTEEINNNLNIYLKMSNPDFGILISEISNNKKIFYQNFIDRWNYSILSASNISKIDGAVIFDSSLKLIGIRSEIVGEPLNKVKIFSISKNNAGIKKENELDINKYGTRHRSSIRFAYNCPGSFVIVISQDGDINIITRKGEDILFCGPMRIISGESPV